MNSILMANVICEDNRKYSNESLKALADDIRVNGLINPITLNEAHKVIAGRRRFRALELNNVTQLDESMYKISDKNSAVIAFSENHHREQLTIAEEVAELAELQKVSKKTLSNAELGALIGRSSEYVACRLNLSKLTGEWLKVLQNHEDYPQLTVKRLEQVSRMPSEWQKRNEYLIKRTHSNKEWKNLISKNEFPLNKALFDTAICKNCLNSSANAPELFPEFAPKAVVCLNEECFEYHQLLKIAEETKLLKAKYYESKLKPFYLIVEEYPNLGRAAKILEQIQPCLRSWQYEIDTKDDVEPNAFIISGDNIGTMAKIKTSYTELAINPPKKKGSTATNEEVTAKKEKTLADREAELKAKRNKLAIQAFADYIITPEAYDEFIGQGIESAFIICKTLTLAYGIKRPYKNYSYLDISNYLDMLAKNMTEADYVENWWASLKCSLRETLMGDISGTLNQITDIDALAIEKVLGIEFSRFYEQACIDIPEPKALLKARLESKEVK